MEIASSESAPSQSPKQLTPSFQRWRKYLNERYLINYLEAKNIISKVIALLLKKKKPELPYRKEKIKKYYVEILKILRGK